jgi:hypothetical protein
MFLRIWRFATILLAVLSLTMESAHVLEPPQKMQYDARLYSPVNTTLYRYFTIVGAAKPGDAMTDFEDLQYCGTLASKIIEIMPGEQLSDCLCMLALQLAEYRYRFGEIPPQDLLALLRADEVTHHQAQLLRDGMELLVSCLASVREDWERAEAPIQ